MRSTPDSMSTAARSAAANAATSHCACRGDTAGDPYWLKLARRPAGSVNNEPGAGGEGTTSACGLPTCGAVTGGPTEMGAGTAGADTTSTGGGRAAAAVSGVYTPLMATPLPVDRWPAGMAVAAVAAAAADRGSGGATGRGGDNRLNVAAPGAAVAMAAVATLPAMVGKGNDAKDSRL